MPKRPVYETLRLSEAEFKQRLYELYTERKYSESEIAHQLGISQPTVSNYLRKYGIKTRAVVLIHKRYSEEQLRKILYRMFKQEGKNTVQIANILGVSTTTVSNLLTKYGIHPRTSSPSTVEERLQLGPNIRKQLSRLYQEKGSVSRVASALQISYRSAHRLLNENGIPLKKPGAGSHRNKAH